MRGILCRRHSSYPGSFAAARLSVLPGTRSPRRFRCRGRIADEYRPRHHPTPDPPGIRRRRPRRLDHWRADGGRMRRRSHRRGAGPRGRNGQRYLGAPDRHGSRPLCRDDHRSHGRGRGGDADHRRRHRLAGHQFPISGAGTVRMVAPPAAGHSVLRHRIRLHRLPRVRGAGAGAAQGTRRLDVAPGLLVPGNSLPRRRHRGHVPGSLPLCLFAIAGRLSRTVGGNDGSQPLPRPGAVAQFSDRRGASGPPVHRRRRFAGADGNAERFRHGGFLCRPDPDPRHLRRLVQPQQRRRRRPDRRRPYCFSSWSCWPPSVSARRRQRYHGQGGPLRRAVPRPLAGFHRAPRHAGVRASPGARFSAARRPAVGGRLGQSRTGRGRGVSDQRRQQPASRGPLPPLSRC